VIEVNQIIRIRIDKTVRGGQILKNKRCNLNCLWCHGDFFHHQKKQRAINNDQIAEAVQKVIEVLDANANNVMVKISGEGEPTLAGEKELGNLIVVLKNQVKVKEVNLVTNGILLSSMVKSLATAGLDGVNVSINSLNREIYSFITGADKLECAIKGMESSLRYGLKTKINICYTKLNDNEVFDFIKFSQEHDGVMIKFFDLLITNNLCKRLYLPLEKLVDKIERIASERKVIKSPYWGYEYSIQPNAHVYVKVASTQNNCPNTACNFRDKCLEGCRSSIRISQDGTLHPCGVRIDNVVSLIEPKVTIEDIKQALLSGGKGWGPK
jgi:molybdenum cofactor biosynthesis enzyme MoaA